MTRTEQWIDRHPRLTNWLSMLVILVHYINFALDGTRRNGDLMWSHQPMSTEEYFRWVRKICRKAGYKQA